MFRGPWKWRPARYPLYVAAVIAAVDRMLQLFPPPLQIKRCLNCQSQVCLVNFDGRIESDIGRPSREGTSTRMTKTGRPATGLSTYHVQAEQSVACAPLFMGSRSTRRAAVARTTPTGCSGNTPPDIGTPQCQPSCPRHSQSTDPSFGVCHAVSFDVYGLPGGQGDRVHHTIENRCRGLTHSLAPPDATPIRGMPTTR